MALNKDQKAGIIWSVYEAEMRHRRAEYEAALRKETNLDWLEKKSWWEGPTGDSTRIFALDNGVMTQFVAVIQERLDRKFTWYVKKDRHSKTPPYRQEAHQVYDTHHEASIHMREFLEVLFKDGIFNGKKFNRS